MSLESTVAKWIELGVRPYEEVMKMQAVLVKLRSSDSIPDTVLSVQHPLSINFGASHKDNQFSESLLRRVKEDYGNCKHDSVLRYLTEQRISFHQSDRGGGATAFSPGQYVFYPIVKHAAITGKPPLDIAAYKNLIYSALFDSLKNLGIEGVNVSNQQSFTDRNERKDAWIERAGVTLKMGSKGIKISGDVAYHGFALYVEKNCIIPNQWVNQCGYRPEEVKLWTVEHELGRKVSADEVYGAVKNAIGKNFGYSHFNIIAAHTEEVFA